MPKERIYYDVVATGTSATSHAFFAHDEATDGEKVTNVPTPSQLDKDFTLEEIHLIPAADLARADHLKLTEKAIVKLVVGTDTIFKLPAVMCLSDAAFSTEGTVGTGEIMSAWKFTGGHKVTPPVKIPANTRFNVYLEINSAFGTDTNITCIMLGSEA